MGIFACQPHVAASMQPSPFVKHRWPWLICTQLAISVPGSEPRPCMEMQAAITRSLQVASESLKHMQHVA